MHLIALVINENVCLLGLPTKFLKTYAESFDGPLWDQGGAADVVHVVMAL